MPIEGLSPQLEPQGISKDLLTKAAEVISGNESTPFDIEWISGNINSIHETVRTGVHETMLYPASGRDLLRTVLAYDVRELFAIDSNQRESGKMELQLDGVGISYMVEESEDKKKKRIHFEMDGKKRTVTQIFTDARLITPKDLGVDQVDVFHLFLPTGATAPIRADEIYLQEQYGDDWYSKQWDQAAREAMAQDSAAPKPDPETGEFAIIAEGIQNELNSKNYALVQEGGFFVFGERRMLTGVQIPSILKLAGLRERQITTRHPHTVLTSWFPTQQEIEAMDRVGYMYQTETEVSRQTIDVVRDMIESQEWTDYIFMEFERGAFNYMEIERGESIDVPTAIQNDYAKLVEATQSYCQRLLDLDSDADIVLAYKEETLGSYRDKITSLQEEVRTLLDKYQDLSARYKLGELTDEQAKSQLQAVHPLAQSLQEDDTDYTETVLEQFATADFQLK